jgi:nucleoside-diphosphate-sugar epimerase
MKVAVTGGSGQLGTLVLERLLADAAVSQVVSLDVRPPLLVDPKLHAVHADVRDLDFERHLARCDALVHLAFVVTKHASAEAAQAINVGGSQNVFEAAARAGVRRIVYSSSIAAYGVVEGHPNPIVESTPRQRQPGFTYAMTKFDVEEGLDAFERAHPDVSVARLRPSILVGAVMDHPLGVAMRRRVMPDTKDAPLPIVWDEDVADAVVLALAAAAHGAFNISSDAARTGKQLAEATGMKVLPSNLAARRVLAEGVDALIRVGLWSGFDPKWIDQSNVAMHITSERAKRELGWHPKHATAVAVVEHFMRTVPRRLDPRVALFLRVAGGAGPARFIDPEDLAGISERVRIVLTGVDGGDFGLVVEDGRLAMHSAPPRPPTSVLTTSSKLFRDILVGEADLGQARASGDVRVRGSSGGVAVLAAIARTLHEGARSAGARGTIVRTVRRALDR